MKKEFKWIKNPTPEQLNQIKVGNIVRINNYKNVMKVQAVSEHYFIMTDINDSNCYSICEKIALASIGYDHQFCKVGYCSIGPDNYYGRYNYENISECEKALSQFESDNDDTGMRLSRYCVSLMKIGVKIDT